MTLPAWWLSFQSSAMVAAVKGRAERVVREEGPGESKENEGDKRLKPGGDFLSLEERDREREGGGVRSSRIKVIVAVDASISLAAVQFSVPC